MKEYIPHLFLLLISILINACATPLQSFMLGLIVFIGYICWKFIEGLCTPDR